MSSLFKDEVFVITGAASGIGRSLAQLLASQGAFLSLADVNAAALAEAKEELQQLIPQRGPESAMTDVRSKGVVKEAILTTALDVRSQAECSQWILDTVAHFGRPIMGAANLAGVVGSSIAQDKGSIRNITDSEFDFVLDVSVKGTLNCLRAQLPHMQQGVNGRGGGSIVNASSISGIVGMEYNGPYVAAKHAVVGLTRTAAKEEGPRAIRVNAVAPGIIATPMMTQIEEYKGTTELFGKGDPGAMGRKGTAEEVARTIEFLLSPHSSFISGVVVTIDGGWIC